jgi:hypothetical protein
MCPCPWLWCLNQSCFWGHLSLPLAVMSESELFFRTFVPALGCDVWIRVVLEDNCPCPWLLCLNQSCFLGHLSLPLAMMSESELVLSPSTVSESKLFCEHLSLFVVSELEIFLEQLYLFILFYSEKFFRRHFLICCV